jgi:hypothetical protein
MDIRSDVVAILPSSSAPLTVHSQQPLSSLRIARTHSLVKPIRHLSLPIKSQVSLPFSTLSSSLITAPSSLERQTHLTCDCSNIPTVPIPSSSSSLFNWSVADVGRFIEKHFPEKNLARVNSSSSSSLHFLIIYYRNLFNKRLMDVHYHY